MIPSGTDIICNYFGEERVARIKSYLGAGVYRIYLLETKTDIDINCKDIIKIDK